ncbi:MAG TPA: hypothetical protein VF812_12265 [Ktedonobacterales bacterium]
MPTPLTQPRVTGPLDFWVVAVIGVRSLFVLPYIWRLTACERATGQPHGSRSSAGLELVGRRSDTTQPPSQIITSPEVTWPPD